MVRRGIIGTFSWGKGNPVDSPWGKNRENGGSQEGKNGVIGTQGASNFPIRKQGFPGGSLTVGPFQLWGFFPNTKTQGGGTQAKNNSFGAAIGGRGKEGLTWIGPHPFGLQGPFRRELPPVGKAPWGNHRAWENSPLLKNKKPPFGRAFATGPGAPRWGTQGTKGLLPPIWDPLGLGFAHF